MYRLLLLVSLVGLTAGECGSRNTRTRSISGKALGWPFGGNGYSSRDESYDWGSDEEDSSSCCQKQKSRSVDSAFAEMARNLVSANSKMRRFCTKYTDHTLIERYGVEHFQIRVRLSGFSDSDIKVRVRQRLVLVHARTCSDEFAALRYLPDVVDAQRAQWKFEGGTLTVMFPYNMNPETQVQSRCGRDFSENVIVPQCDNDTVFKPDYDLSFGDEKLMNTLRRLLKQLNENGGLIEDENVAYIDEDK